MSCGNIEKQEKGGLNMPVCRHCGTRITKFDKDRCPVCGELNPLQDVNSDTVEITSEIDLSKGAFADFKPRKRKTFLILACTIGWLGAHMFYLGSKKPGLIWLISNVVFMAGAFSLLFFVMNSLILGIIVPLLIVYAINVGLAIWLYKNPTLKDADGNLLR